MKNIKFKNSLIIIISVILIIGLFNVFINRNNLDNELLNDSLSLIEKQNIKTNEIKEEISNEVQTYVDPYDIAPLSALITFKSNSPTPVKMTLKGQYNAKDLVSEFDEATDHFIPVYGLFANTNNEIILEYNDKVEVINIQTNPLPENFTKLNEKPYVNETFRDQLTDFYFLTPSAEGYTSGYDIEGNVRWYLSEPLVWEIRYLENGNLTISNEKQINPPYYTTGLYELTMLGQIQKEYILPGGYHHDVTEHKNGNLIVASNDFENNTVEDVIVEVDRDNGDIKKIIDLKEILEVEGGKSENWIDYDWFHNNSVYYDEPTNSLTLSGRHQDIVVNLDYDSLDINYIVGNSDGFSEEFQKYFLIPTNDLEWNYSQHSAKILPNGDLIMFDNGINRSKVMSEYIDAEDNYSRGVIYRIDKDRMEISQIYEYGKDRGSDYYSPYISDTDYLSENHYLIHSGGNAKFESNVLNNAPGLLEFDELNSFTSEVLNDELIFELSLASNYYRAEKMNINQNLKFNLNDAITVGSFSESKYDSASKNYLSKIHDSKQLEQYDISVEKELERLIVQGNFNKSDDVSIILKQNFNQLEYDVRVSQRPYTAMCIVVFDNKEQNVSKYINNSEELVGQYDILIKINGKLYNTGFKVEY